MSRKKRIIAALAFAAGLALVLPILLIPTVACGCLTPPMVFDRVFGVDPVAVEASRIHAAIVEKLPIGSPASAIEETWRALDPGLLDDDSPLEPEAGVIRHDMDLGSSALGIHRRALHLELMVDGAGRLAAVRVRKTRWILGREL